MYGMKAKRRIAAACATLLVGSLMAGAQSAFPFDRDLVLDARAMRGSKRVPVLAIAPDGAMQIDLWCKRGQGQAIIAGDTVTIAIGAMKDEACTAERAQADETLLTMLSQVTGWTQRGDVVTLTGITTLRFRLATN